MKIIVGPGYGGRRANVVKPSFGELICDGQGLVAELELRAGIAHQTVSETKRTVIYLKALRAADHLDRFYHRSLQVDPIACARKLLHWGDSAILYGWRVPKNKISHFGNVEPSSPVVCLDPDLSAGRSGINAAAAGCVCRLLPSTLCGQGFTGLGYGRVVP